MYIYIYIYICNKSMIRINVSGWHTPQYSELSPGSGKLISQKLI